MNKLKGSPSAKIIAVILLAVSCLVLCGAIVGVTWLDGEGAYRDNSIDRVRTSFIDRELQTTCFELLDRMQAMPVRSAYDSTARFELLDEKGNVLAGNLSENETVEQTQTVQIDSYYNSYYNGMYFTAEDQPLMTWERLSRNYDYYSESSSMSESITSPVPVPTVSPTSMPAAGADEMSVPEGT